jgi:hypothetical protein
MSHPQKVKKCSRSVAQGVIKKGLAAPDHFFTPRHEVKKWSGGVGGS